MAKDTFEYISCERCKSKDKSVFCTMCSESLKDINEAKSCTIYKKGETLFRDGGHPLGIFCINTGKVKLTMSGEEGKEQILRLAREGDILGCRSLLVSERYNATAVALEDSRVCFIPKDNFIKNLKTYPTLSIEVLKALSRQLDEADVKITHLAQKSVRERIAETLLSLRATYGMELGTSIINVQLTREEIASLTGTVTETAIRLLQQFNKEKIIELIGKKIKIIDIDKLVKIANVVD